MTTHLTTITTPHAMRAHLEHHGTNHGQPPGAHHGTVLSAAATDAHSEPILVILDTTHTPTDDNTDDAPLIHVSAADTRRNTRQVTTYGIGELRTIGPNNYTPTYPLHVITPPTPHTPCAR